MNTIPKVNNDFLPMVLRDLVVMSSMINIGASLTDAWSPFVLYEENAEVKEFFKAMDKNWRELPKDVLLRVTPTFKPYAQISTEWEFLYLAAKEGEEIGMLNIYLLAASMIILLSFKIKQLPATDSDINLFQTIIPMFPLYDWKKWIEMLALKDETLRNFYHDTYDDAYSLWLEEQVQSVQVKSIVPSYIVDIFSKEIQTVGLQEVDAILKTIKNYNTTINLYRPKHD